MSTYVGLSIHIRLKKELFWDSLNEIGKFFCILFFVFLLVKGSLREMVHNSSYGFSY